MISKNRPRIFVDMDGTVALWRFAASYEEITSPKYFENLIPDRIMCEAIKTLIQKGYDVTFLSCVLNDRCKKEKRKWLNKIGFQDIMLIAVPDGKNKSESVPEIGKKCFLIDDYTKNLNEWAGTPIKYYNGINGTNGKYKGFSVSWDDKNIADKIISYIETIS